MKKKELDDMMDSILLDPNGKVSISKFNRQYWEQDIREKIANWMDKLRKKTQLSSPKSMYFKFLASHSNEYLWHPLPYLALCVIVKKNKNVLKGICSWDIEKLFVKDFSFYEDILQRVTSYYQKIQEKGPTDRNGYTRYMNEMELYKANKCFEIVNKSELINCPIRQGPPMPRGPPKSGLT